MAAALGPYIAGLDTVANACTFLIHALLQHPDVYREVQAEIDRVVGHGPLSPAALKELPALHGAAMETLGVSPVAPASMPVRAC